jgi:hypothetical protein
VTEQQADPSVVHAGGTPEHEGREADGRRKPAVGPVAVRAWARRVSAALDVGYNQWLPAVSIPTNCTAFRPAVPGGRLQEAGEHRFQGGAA